MKQPQFLQVLKSVFIYFETRCSDFHLEVVFLGPFTVWYLCCDPLSALSLVHNIPGLCGLKLLLLLLSRFSRVRLCATP